MNYELDLLIDKADLPLLRSAGLKISLAKPVGNQAPNTIWLAFDPFEANKVEWVEDYGVYASNTVNLEHGTSISKISEVFPAVNDQTYTFDSSATFNTTSEVHPGTGVFGVKNEMPYEKYPSLAFGLEQKATVQGAEILPQPINTALIPAMFDAKFTPLVTVYVWLQADYKSGTVITQVHDQMIPVTFGGEVTKQSLVYKPSSGQFILAS